MRQAIGFPTLGILVIGELADVVVGWMVELSKIGEDETGLERFLSKSPSTGYKSKVIHLWYIYSYMNG